MKIQMTDETPDFVCRGCGYHEKNCVCTAQKEPVITQIVKGFLLLKNGLAKLTSISIAEDLVM